MKRTALVLFWIALLILPLCAQRAQRAKLSPLLRQIVRAEHHPKKATSTPKSTLLTPHSSLLTPNSTLPSVCAFIRIEGDGSQVLRDYGCRELLRKGNIYIADIPISSLEALALDARVLRIEARQGNSIALDSTAMHIHATDVYTGFGLPQAYTGRGVVMGIMDIGFDLTHPTFYSRDTTEYRIRAFWDMLDTDTVGSNLYVGRDYFGRDTLLAVAHARDGLTQQHGTHTAGIAAGSGYNSAYRGLAPDADICLVANAVSDDMAYIDSADYYNYTFATDALGFKYIFDYAEAHHQPCVISFSEGSGQDFWGYDQLYYEMLDSLTGPGRIIVSAAGTDGANKTYIHKPIGKVSAGTFLYASNQSMMVTLKARHTFDIRLVAYHSDSWSDTLIVSTSKILAQADSVLNDTIFQIDNRALTVLIEAYPNCYDASETCYDLTFTDNTSIGGSPSLSLELLGTDADIEAYRVTGNFTTSALNPALSDGDTSHTILSPSSSPGVICVGMTTYRKGFLSYNGNYISRFADADGRRQPYSSVGPTFDGRIKPDVMAPGNYVISSNSSYFLEANPDYAYNYFDVERFDFNGRTYVWGTNTGTSMASPVVGGAIALWLEACPTLTPQDVMGVISRTSRHYDPSLSYPNNEYGYGEIDVYAGLLDILQFSKINDISTTPSTAQVTYANRSLHVTFDTPTTAPVRLRLFAISGKVLLDAKVPAGLTTYSLPCPTLSTAVYAVQLNGSAAASTSTLLRIN